MEWTNTQVYPEGLALVISYNPDQIQPDISEVRALDDEDDENITVPCIFRNMVALTCEYPKDEPGVIRVTDLIQAE